MNKHEQAMESVKVYVKQHLTEICKELKSWSETGILVDGRVREAGELLQGTVDVHHHRISIVEFEVKHLLIENHLNDVKPDLMNIPIVLELPDGDNRIIKKMWRSVLDGTISLCIAVDDPVPAVVDPDPVDLEPIPKGVYYIGSNFYNAENKMGMGDLFWGNWHTRRKEFPVSAQEAFARMLEPSQKGDPGQVIHQDDVAVNRFVIAMKEKMAEKREQGYGGWNDPSQCTIGHLRRLLDKEINDPNKGDYVDIANFAMMLYMRGERKYGE